MKPIIGQECVCPDGLGRVVEFKLDGIRKFIKVSTYINDRCCNWDPCNVKLVKINLEIINE